MSEDYTNTIDVKDSAIVRLLLQLRYTMGPINWQFEGLTPEEQAIWENQENLNVFRKACKIVLVKE